MAGESGVGARRRSAAGGTRLAAGSASVAGVPGGDRALVGPLSNQLVSKAAQGELRSAWVSTQRVHWRTSRPASNGSHS